MSLWGQLLEHPPVEVQRSAVKMPLSMVADVSLEQALVGVS